MEIKKCSKRREIGMILKIQGYNEIEGNKGEWLNLKECERKNGRWFNNNTKTLRKNDFRMEYKWVWKGFKKLEWNTMTWNYENEISWVLRSKEKYGTWRSVEVTQAINGLKMNFRSRASVKGGTKDFNNGLWQKWGDIKFI